MAFASFNDHDEEISEINITPLVDIMLVLLIVFMLAMPVFTSSININLPTSSQTKIVEAPTLINLSVDSQGNYYFKEQKVSLEELNQLLNDEYKVDPKLVVAIRADKSVSYEFVMRLLDQIRRVGVTKIGFVTEVVN